MKKICLYLTTLVLLSVLVVGCSKEKLDPNSVIVDRLVTENAFDKWLYEHFVKPYNVQIEYRFVCSDLPLEYNLVPAEFEKSISLAQVMLFTALEPYDVVTGSTAFNRSMFPKFINFVGSGAYTNTGTVILGTAEDGIKVILYRVNLWNPDLSAVEHNDFYPQSLGGIRFFSTIHHELAHILHQRRMYPSSFREISRLHYTGDEWNSTTNTHELARRNGFISRYASSEENEDFVELFAHFIMTDSIWWEDALESARVLNPVWEATPHDTIPKYLSTSGADAIESKLNIVKNYMRVEWGIDMIALRREIGRRIALLPEMTFKTYNEL